MDYGTQVSAAEARRWACDAKIIPVVLGGKSEPPTLAGPCEPCRYRSAERWLRGTAAVFFRVVIGHRECTRRIIVCTGSTMVKPV